MQPLEWLQWELIPRLRGRLDAHLALPQNFAVAPYYGRVLDVNVPGCTVLLVHLNTLDALFVAPPD